MSNNLTISLTNLRFNAFHGLYADEKKTGNEFVVNLHVQYEPTSGMVTGISDTINYETLFTLLQTEMQKPRDLLETLAMEFAEIVHRSFSKVTKIDISITKLNPPIPRFTGHVGVKYSVSY